MPGERPPIEAAAPAAEGRPEEAVTLAGVFAWHVARHAEREPIRLLGEGDEAQTLTYGGLYEMAKRVALALRPYDVAGSSVALRGTRTVWPAGSWRPRPAPVSVVFGAPLEPAGGDWETAVRRRGSARAHVAAHCGESALPARSGAEDRS
jgi:hypothetical protein